MKNYYIRAGFAFLVSIVLHLLLLRGNIKKNNYKRNNLSREIMNVKLRKKERKNIEKKRVAKKVKKDKSYKKDKKNTNKIDKSTIKNSSNNITKSKKSKSRSDNYEKAKIFYKKPEYPYMARKMNHEGDVYIKVIIGKNDNIIDYFIDKSSGYDRLDKAVINSIKNAEVKSAEKNGKRVKSIKIVGPFKFRLEE